MRLSGFGHLGPIVETGRFRMKLFRQTRRTLKEAVQMILTESRQACVLYPSSFSNFPFVKISMWSVVGFPSAEECTAQIAQFGISFVKNRLGS